jgi:hypothetical protein
MNSQADLCPLKRMEAVAGGEDEGEGVMLEVVGEAIGRNPIPLRNLVANVTDINYI